MKKSTLLNNYLFVYGTLRDGIDVPVKKEIESDLEWLSLSAIRGKMYDIGEYPGAKPAKGNNAKIIGGVYRMKRPRKVLSVLDEYEGYDRENLKKSEYLRTKEAIELENGKKVKGWVYWYNLPIVGKLRIPNSNYLDYLKKKSV